MNFKQCPAKFEFYYNDEGYWNYGTSDDKSNMDTWRGNEFHDFAETFFDKIKGLEPEEWTKQFEPHEDEIVQKYIDWFVSTEIERYNDLKSLDKLDFFNPLANELKITMEDEIDRTGHVDRIDLMPNGDICIVEYKAGKSYDMTNIDRVTSMNSEIGWYVNILNAIEHYPDKKITHWKVINPRLEKIWMNKISPISLKTVEKIYADMVNRIKKGLKFEKKTGTLCYYCPYLQKCDPFWEEEVELNFDQ